jgi:hypothetical protein
MLLAQTTQPCPNLWTPGEVIALMSAFSTLVLGGFFAGWLKVIDAQKNSKLAIIAAAKATGKSEANSDAIIGLQHQVTSVALATAPPSAPRSPVVPATFADAQLRAAADPDCPPQDVTTTTTTTTTTPPATEG